MQIFECRKNLLLGPFPKQSYTYGEIKTELVRPYVKAAYTKLTLCASSNKRNEGICHVSCSQCEKIINLLLVQKIFVKSTSN